jgi:mRNA interferase MazF
MIGHEQGGRRPALVLSHEAYNQKVGLCIACPITSQAKGYPFEVSLPSGLPVTGVVLADHVKNVEWRARQSEFICECPTDVLEELLQKLEPLIY